MDLNGHSLGEGVVNGDLTLLGGTVKLNGSDVRVDGDLTATSTTELGSGTLTVTGDLYQQGGGIRTDMGRLYIDGNCYIAGAGTVLTEGYEVYKSSTGYIQMNDDRAEVHIGGDFLTVTSTAPTLSAGTMYIGGDFHQVNGNKSGFEAYGTHKVVLNGKGKQKATFEGSSSHFNILELTKPMNYYVFTPNNCWNTINAPAALTLGTPDLVLPASLQRIEEEAFEGMTAKIVYVPDTCTEIGSNAFRNSGIEKIRIPAGCTIADSAFDGCEEVIIFGTAGSPAESFCESDDRFMFVEEAEN